MPDMRALSTLLLCLALGGCGPAEPGAQTVAVAPPWDSGGGEGGAWSYRPLACGADCTVEVTLRIEAPSGSGEPLHQLDRYAGYNRNEDMGGYEAGLSLRRGEAGQYRFMLSALFGEAVLWSSAGGILAVRPAPVAAGRALRLRASAEGPRLRLWIDGALVIDAWDGALSEGGAALARKEGVSSFGVATATTAGASAVAAPAPLVSLRAPRLALRSWRGARWGFDGDEPIFALGGSPAQAAAYAPGLIEAIAYEVKLRRGEGAQVYLPLFMQNDGDALFRLSRLKDLQVTEEGERLAFTLLTEEESGRYGLRGRSDVTISFVEGSYVWDVRSELTVPEGPGLLTAHPIDITDAGYYGVVLSGTPGWSWPVDYTHFVYQLESGALTRRPLNHVGFYPGYGTERWHAERMGYIKPDGGFFSLVGSPRSNPVLELREEPGRRQFDAGPCGLGYDLHLRWVPGGEPGAVVPPGTHAVRWRMRSAPALEADGWLARAGYATPGDLSLTWLLYTGGVGHVERFDKVVPQASTFGEYPWGLGALQDPAGGRGGGAALRLDGATFADAAAGSGRFTEDIPPGQDYEVSAWVRTEDVRGEGPGIVFGDRAYYPGLRGSGPWRRIGFVARPREPLDVVPIFLHNSGAGTVWFDDLLIRPLSAAQPPEPALANAPRELLEAAQGTRSDLRLLWAPGSEAGDRGGTVLDLSGHGHHGALVNGAAWATAEGGRVVDLPAGAAERAAHVVLRGHPRTDLGAPATLSLWLRPQRAPSEWAAVASGGPRQERDSWRVVLLASDGEGLRLVAQLPGGQLASAGPVVPLGRFSHLALVHDGATLAVYIDGRELLRGAAQGPWLGRGTDGWLRLGAGAIEGRTHSPFVGQLGTARVAPRALSQSEIESEYRAGR